MDGDKKRKRSVSIANEVKVQEDDDMAGGEEEKQEEEDEGEDFSAAEILEIFKSSPDKELGCSLTAMKLQSVLALYKEYWLGPRLKADEKAAENADEICLKASERLDIRSETGELLPIHQITTDMVEKAYKKEMFRWVTLQQVRT